MASAPDGPGRGTPPPGAVTPMTPIRPDILQRQQQTLEQNRRRQMVQALQQPQPVNRGIAQAQMAPGAARVPMQAQRLKYFR